MVMSWCDKRGPSTMLARAAAGFPQVLGVPQIVKAAEALVARVETSGGSMSGISTTSSRELPPLQAPTGQPPPGYVHLPTQGVLSG